MGNKFLVEAIDKSGTDIISVLRGGLISDVTSVNMRALGKGQTHIVFTAISDTKEDEQIRSVIRDIEAALEQTGAEQIKVRSLGAAEACYRTKNPDEKDVRMSPPEFPFAPALARVSQA